MRDVKVFVYGTLRSDGQGAHILHGYRLYDLGPFPCIKKEDGFSVVGDIIHVTKAFLAQLDRIEGVDRGFYTRETVKVDNITCYVYVAGNVLDHDVTPVPVASGDWHNHPSKRKRVFRPFL